MFCDITVTHNGSIATSFHHAKWQFETCICDSLWYAIVTVWNQHQPQFATHNCNTSRDTMPMATVWDMFIVNVNALHRQISGGGDEAQIYYYSLHVRNLWINLLRFRYGYVDKLGSIYWWIWEGSDTDMWTTLLRGSAGCIQCQWPLWLCLKVPFHFRVTADDYWTTPGDCAVSVSDVHGRR